MTGELHVWWGRECVGVLSAAGGRLGFSYGAGWWQRPDARPLSRSLPLQAAPFDDAVARPFFAGLLPEGQLRQLIARQFRVSTRNDFALLGHVGGECAGAVSLLPAGMAPPPATRSDEVRWLDEAALASLLEELPRRPMLAGETGLRLSLAGAQDKLPVLFDGERVGLPLHGTPSSHILKPAIPLLEDTVINEAYCMALANAMQLGAARTLVRTAQGRTFLLVERYDRTLDAAGQRQRLHQEDFCQALGVVPEMKYQNEGGPSLAKCFELLRAAARPSAPQVLRLFDLVVFNALVGNHDAHAKNFSLLHTGTATVLSPGYDLLSTAVYPRLTPKMAMKIGGRYRFSELEVRHWERFMAEVGLSLALGRKRLLALATALPHAAAALRADPKQPFAGHPLVERIQQLLAERCALLIRRLQSTNSGPAS